MFYINISNGLIIDGHRWRMGSSVWEFMWLIDHITSIDEDGWGKVLGGRPITFDEIAESFGREYKGAEVHPVKTIGRNIKRLTEQGYIRSKRTPAGLIFEVKKAKKPFKKKTVHKAVHNQWAAKKRKDNIVRSDRT